MPFGPEDRRRDPEDRAGGQRKAAWKQQQWLEWQQTADGDLTKKKQKKWWAFWRKASIVADEHELSSPKKTYVPRHAERDARLSMPVQGPQRHLRDPGAGKWFAGMSVQSDSLPPSSASADQSVDGKFDRLEVYGGPADMSRTPHRFSNSPPSQKDKALGSTLFSNGGSASGSADLANGQLGEPLSSSPSTSGQSTDGQYPKLARKLTQLERRRSVPARRHSNGERYPLLRAPALQDFGRDSVIETPGPPRNKGKAKMMEVPIVRPMPRLRASSTQGWVVEHARQPGRWTLNGHLSML